MQGRSEILVLAACLAGAGLFATAPARAGLAEDRARTLARLSLEQLMDVEVTTVLGAAQTRESAPAALHLITGDDIRRSGHRTLAEALRLVPGMYVGRTSSSGWIIGARGLTGSAISATRYLVMIDGRVVYDPLISATFWDTTDVPLSDIDRIEVIRGPGATLWGANAMNGVINVITKDARETQGTYVNVGGGDYERAYATLRQGVMLGDAGLRIFTKYTERDAFETATGASNDDAWSMLRAGLRLDAPIGHGTHLVVASQVYEHPRARASVRLPVPGRHQVFEQVAGNDEVTGGHVLARAEHTHADHSRTTVQAYFDGMRRETARFGAERATFDLDARHQRHWGRGHELAFGLQYNQTADDLVDGPVVQFDPSDRRWTTWNAFVQNTFALGDRATLAVGTKLTHHDFVGLEWQPGVRASWTASDDHTFWAAVSRPVRVPSRLEEDGLIVLSYADTGLIAGRPATNTIVPIGLAGDDELRAEQLVAWEVGHRVHLGDRVHLDTAAFYNDYRRLIGVPPEVAGTFTDAGTGVTRGLDVSATIQAGDHWRLEGSVSWLDVDVGGPVLPFEEDGAPRRMAQARSYFDIGEDVELVAAAYYVDEVPRIPAEAYTRIDLGVRWRIRDGVELAVYGQNLAERSHNEASLVQVPRSVYAQVTFRSAR